MAEREESLQKARLHRKALKANLCSVLLSSPVGHAGGDSSDDWCDQVVWIDIARE